MTLSGFPFIIENPSPVWGFADSVGGDIQGMDPPIVLPKGQKITVYPGKWEYYEVVGGPFDGLIVPTS